MRNRITKGLRPSIIKYMAVLMGICYVMNPLHEPINSIFHKISHSMESPIHILSHSSISTLEHASNDHFDHSVLEMAHEHGLLDLISSLFEASDEKNNQKDPLRTKIKIDKHTVTYHFKLQKYTPIIIIQAFWIHQMKSKHGYLEKLKRPPQNFLG